jgi:hypothetical protein
MLMRRMSADLLDGHTRSVAQLRKAAAMCSLKPFRKTIAPWKSLSAGFKCKKKLQQ